MPHADGAFFEQLDYSLQPTPGEFRLDRHRESRRYWLCNRDQRAPNHFVPRPLAGCPATMAPERSDKARNEHFNYANAMSARTCPSRPSFFFLMDLLPQCCSSGIRIGRADGRRRRRGRGGGGGEEEEGERRSRIKEFPRRTRPPSCLRIGCVAGTVGQELKRA